MADGIVLSVLSILTIDASSFLFFNPPLSSFFLVVVPQVARTNVKY
jgi:hypothetical protein